MGIPKKIYPFFSLGIQKKKKKKINRFFSCKGREDMGIPKISDCFLVQKMEIPNCFTVLVTKKWKFPIYFTNFRILNVFKDNFQLKIYLSSLGGASNFWNSQVRLFMHTNGLITSFYLQVCLFFCEMRNISKQYRRVLFNIYNKSCINVNHVHEKFYMYMWKTRKRKYPKNVKYRKIS